ncbi:MAG: YqaA family protein [Breznakibacter sp.]
MEFEIGYLGLFMATFLAATVIPFSSEIVLTAMLMAGFDPVTTLTVATFGNWLGSMSTYGLGRLGKMEWIHKYLRIPQSKIDKAHKYVEGRMAWIALLCWLPLVGDVIAVVLGLLRSNFWLTTIGMFVGKAIRFLVWGYFTLMAIG